MGIAITTLASKATVSKECIQCVDNVHLLSYEWKCQPLHTYTPPNSILFEPKFQSCWQKAGSTFWNCPIMLYGSGFNQCFSTQEH
jgi:hypothetical protein